MTYLSRTRFSFVLASTLTLVSGSALGAFFQVAEQSPSGQGNAFAGGAAIAKDASTVWYNSAGLTRLQGKQAVAGVHFISPSVNYDDAGSTTVTGATLGTNDGGNAGDDAFVPNFYYAQPINDQLTFGVGVNAPFGLVTEYDDTWVGRYYAIKSDIKTINVNPAVGYKLNDRFSIGGGISVQRIEATLNQRIDTGTAGAGAPLFLVPTMDDSFGEFTADDTSFGYNFGALWELNEDTRVGVAYRSAVRFELDGDFDAHTVAGTASPAAAIDAFRAGAAAMGLGPPDSDGVEADVTLPATFSVSVYHELDETWAIMGDVTQTRWGRLPELRIEFDSGAPDSVITLDLDDVLRYSFGATYRHNNRWAYRFGVAFDETPTPNAEARTPRLPDEDRTWFTFGANYKRDERLTFDFAYTFVKFDDADINKSTAVPEDTLRGNLVGEYEFDIHILSAQLDWKFQIR